MRLERNLNIYYGDLLDQGSLERLISDIQPDEIYNLAAQSHVRISFDIPQFTVQSNAIGVLNILEAYRRACLPQDSIKLVHLKCLVTLLLMGSKEKQQYDTSKSL
jgi:GDP-D-mannose dehydratase